MSHHRETVTAPGRAGRRRPLLARRQVARPDLPAPARSPLDPDDRRRSSRATLGEQARRCLENLAIVAAAAGASSTTPSAARIYVTDMSRVQGGQRGLRRALRVAIRRRARTIGVAALPARRRGRDRRDPRPPGLMTVTAAATVAAATPRRSRRVARRTPVLSTRTISERAGGTVVLKAENLQRTGSFKVRGVVGQARRARATECARAASSPRRAGNHAQALAAAAARARRAVRGLRARRRADRQGRGRARPGRDRPHRRRLASTSASPPRRSARSDGGLAFVHPFDDPDDRRRPGLARARAARGRARPRAGRRARSAAAGCAAGVAIAVKSARPDVEVVGVQAAACAPVSRSRSSAASRSRPTRALTIADGIAVKRPGDLTLAAARRAGSTAWSSWRGRDAPRRWSLLLERCKLVVEGAGAVGVAALLGGQVAPAARGTTVAILSRRERRRRACCCRSPAATRRWPAAAWSLLTRVPDRPGSLAGAAARGRRRRREHRRRLARARGLRPARARDRGRARARDARPRARRPRDDGDARRRLLRPAAGVGRRQPSTLPSPPA